MLRAVRLQSINGQCHSIERHRRSGIRADQIDWDSKISGGLIQGIGWRPSSVQVLNQAGTRAIRLSAPEHGRNSARTGLAQRSQPRTQRFRYSSS